VELQEQQRQDGHDMTNEEKIILLNNRIDNFNIHIGILEKDILDNPNDDHPDKPLRQDVLNNFYAMRQAIVQEIEELTA
jgi:hypothetical protein